MTDPRALQMDAARLEQATEWLIRLQEDDVGDEEIVRWIDWCEADADNRKVFQSLLPLWEAFDDRPPPASIGALLTEHGWTALTERGVTTSSEEGRTPFAEQARPADNVARLDKNRVKPAGTYARLPLAAAAVVLVVVTAVVSVWYNERGAGQVLPPIATLESKPGHMRPVVLPDGSKLDLGARSAVAINFTGQRRQIEMEDGEAFFAVKPDKQKPFVVHAGAVRVTAVGTQFNVQKTGTRVVVTVSEGAVRTDSAIPATAGGGKQAPDDPAAQPVLAPAGYQVIYDAALSSKPTMRAIDPAAAIAWRQGHLEYDAEPLSSVIAAVNRYSRQTVVLDDSLARLNYTGTIEVGSVDEWLQALPRIFPVQIERAPGDELRIARRP